MYVMKHNPPEVRRRFDQFRPGALSISALVAGELWHGVAKSRLRARNDTALRQFLANLQVLDWPTEAASIYGEIRAALERQGRLIGGMDMLIAAHAMQAQAVLVTRNAREFRRVRGLRLENWVTN
ncbi:MAG: type II toxin-antitoxin system VapC family toxin [Candidatus Binataceae bacterium]